MKINQPSLDDFSQDLQDLRDGNIKRTSADGISEQFHWKQFFKSQINFWSSLPEEAKLEYLDKLTKSSGKSTMSSFELYTYLAKDFHLAHFSTFNIEMLDKLIQRVNPTTIIDPCMGWGHRLLMSWSKQIPYYGFDINKETVDSNIKLAEFLNSNLNVLIEIQCMDGAKGIQTLTDLPDNSMMFTCPPYYDSEKYSDEGIENSSYQEFLDWWQDIAKVSIDKGIKTFTFQITPNYGEDMAKVVSAVGYVQQESIFNTRIVDNTLHYNVKGKLSKRQYGQIYVFKLEGDK